MLRALPTAFAALALASTAEAAEPMVRSDEPATVVAALTAKGLAPQLSAAANGDPKIVATAGGDKFYIGFLGCDKTKKCTALSLYYGIVAAKKPSIAQVNQFNFEHVLLRSYVDGDGDPNIKMDIDLDDGGMSPAGFASELDAWTQTMSDLNKLAAGA